MWIKNVRLLPELSDGIASDSGAVRVESGVIKEVDVAVSHTQDDYVLDGKGMTLLPGFIDAHTHMACLRGYDSSQLRDPLHFFTDVCFMVQRYLDYGFTTIRDCGVPLRVNTAVRDAIERELFRGPRVISCGLILSPTEVSDDDPICDMYSWVDGADEMRKAVRKELAQQADFVKVMASGSAMHRHGIPVQPIIGRQEIQTATEAAALKGSYVAAHAHGDGAIRLCAEAGVRTIEHATYIGIETTEALLKQKNCWLIPTISAMYQNPDTTSEAFRYLIEKLAKMLETSAACLGAAYRAGVPMGFGTDSCPGMDQYEHGIEFRYRSEYCGMKNIDILLQATKNNAEALGIDHLTGQIRTGLCADLVLVNGDPSKDLSVLYDKPAAVIARGRVVRGIDQFS